jgi:perosamine synthetase
MLAIKGGTPVLENEPRDMFQWPIITEEDESAVLGVLRAGTMSGTEITRQFERAFSQWIGSKHALAYPNGTESLRAAMWAVGVRAGDEIIAPSMTYWASAAQAVALGGTVNFADIDPLTLCIDPHDIEHRIGPRTRAIMVVHYAGYPCEMDQIIPIANRYGLAIIEDVSHAHGSTYRGQKCGTMGLVAGMSMMSGKSFPVGEGGMLVTEDDTVYQRAVAYGHYERTGAPSRFNPPDNQISDPDLLPYRGIPLGAFKHRMNQTCSAMGMSQLNRYPETINEIQKALNYFWDALSDVPGVRAHRPQTDSGSTMGGWYYPQGIYVQDEVFDTPLEVFCEAIRHEGFRGCYPGGNSPLHLHPFFHTADIFGMGKPTVVSFGQRDVRQGMGTLPVSERISQFVFTVPWFKHFDRSTIDRYVDVFRKVCFGAEQLVA